MEIDIGLDTYISYYTIGQGHSGRLEVAEAPSS
jgi:hypothetical protein